MIRPTLSKSMPWGLHSPQAAVIHHMPAKPQPKIPYTTATFLLFLAKQLISICAVL